MLGNGLAAAYSSAMLVDPIPGGRSVIVDERMLEWIACRIPAMGPGYQWQMASAIGIGAKGKIIAGLAVHNYLPHFKSCEVTFATSSPLWATKQTITALLRYPFIQLGVRRINAIVAETNTKIIRVVEHIGFKFEGRCRYGCGSEDALIYGMLREDAPEWMDFAKGFD